MSAAATSSLTVDAAFGRTVVVSQHVLSFWVRTVSAVASAAGHTERSPAVSAWSNTGQNVSLPASESATVCQIVNSRLEVAAARAVVTEDRGQRGGGTGQKWAGGPC